MNKSFVFKELDIEGQSTLESISEATRFNQWMYEVTSQNLKGTVLEIGSGIGNISEHYLQAGRPLMLSDIRTNYCQHLEKEFGHSPACLGVMNLDLVHPHFDSIYAQHLGVYDGIFALNVVEHIENDVLAIANCKKLLKTGGKLVILVPAYAWLYNSFDRALEHYRRYNVRSLKDIFQKNNLKIVHSQYFNAAAIAGWWFSGHILKNEVIPNNQMKFYNALVPGFKIIDKCLFNRIGISVIVEGVKE
jgi:2-polyprenyl-3-methyl-5-hydroxy-6-metoxy-1,4-benzoquinol methylase